MRDRLTRAGTVENTRNENFVRLKQRFASHGNAGKQLTKEQFVKAFELLNTTQARANHQLPNTTQASKADVDLGGCGDTDPLGLASDAGHKWQKLRASVILPKQLMWQTYAAAIFDAADKKRAGVINYVEFMRTSRTNPYLFPQLEVKNFMRINLTGFMRPVFCMGLNILT